MMDIELSFEQGCEIIKAIYERSRMPAILLEPELASTGPYDSKFGGKPYLPPGFTYPTRCGSDVPLLFLAQLNFARLPKLPGFPESGILQFYAAIDAHHLSEDHMDSHFVVYHESLCQDLSKLQQPPVCKPPNNLTFFYRLLHPRQSAEFKRNYYSDPPIKGDFKLRTSLIDSYIQNEDDSRYESLLKQVLTEKFSFIEIDTQTVKDQLDNIQSGKEFEKSSLSLEYLNGYLEAKIGGYPDFWQKVPESVENHSVLLLQMASLFNDESNDDHYIGLGDCGTLKFIIDDADLKSRDFSKTGFSGIIPDYLPRALLLLFHCHSNAPRWPGEPQTKVIIW